MREVTWDPLTAVKPVAKVYVVWIGSVMLPDCGFVDVVRL